MTRSDTPAVAIVSDRVSPYGHATHADLDGHVRAVVEVIPGVRRLARPGGC